MMPGVLVRCSNAETGLAARLAWVMVAAKGFVARAGEGRRAMIVDDRGACASGDTPGHRHRDDGGSSMSREGDRMRKALRAHLSPALAAAGFVGHANHFMRLRDDAQDLLSIQYWKYGGSFIFEFGRRARGPLQTAWGPVIPEERLEVAYLPIQDRARLQARDAPPSDLFAGFSFAGFGDDLDRYEQLARRVAGCLPQVEAWLSEREVGPDVTTFGGC